MRYNLILFMLTTVFTSNGYAWHTSSPAKKFEITINKIELCTGAPLSSTADTSCNNPHIVRDTPTTVDIASKNIGEALANFGNSRSLTTGITYTHVRITIDRKMTIATSMAYTNDPTTNSYCTTEPLSSPSPTGGKYGSILVGALSDSEITDPPDCTFYLANHAVITWCYNNDCSTSGTYTHSISDDRSQGNYPALAMTELDNNTDEQKLIYALQSPYTTSNSITPNLNIAIGTSRAINWNRNAGLGNCSLRLIAPSMVISMS